MSEQPSLFSEEELWQQGVEKRCKFLDKPCLPVPCLIAQGISCCIECESLRADEGCRIAYKKKLRAAK